jgi:acyl carrier protein
MPDDKGVAVSESLPSLQATLATMHDVLTRRFGVDRPGLDESTEIASLGLDSLTFVEYTFELENVLHILLPDIPRDLSTVGDLARFVHGEVLKQASSAPQ